MNAELFETWAMNIGVTLLIGFMFFIIYDLGKRANAGKFGMMILLIGLGLGMVGFIIKTVLVEVLDL
ncbi:MULTISPECIES: DUF2788 domain-containing protein [Oceanospirillaceae]|jgi:hypothetical protein|uniref:DUF2788 domain-containing protein n=1 Tax=Oceanospirillaceae TaxID=135620 RepID=UPI000C534906|nr:MULTISPECIES: DUF2788 domain-containing protein [Thalassolituus]MBU2039229.1 DUF2788 domain-containing protein [Gammaproteobacteria bacterium]PIQ38892.1 MAG: hypothetical protein COW58_14790 [Thalassolituus sp. CG17_big_fil_post_rev_8_21_14_2_50_53_8]MCA6060246.1 DUF2788 domain-containing protein [Thalassolituus sp. ST750PaO-4]MCB2388578.1 DUF2788 domain-containing protein [Thalassolituus alkanivorans]MCB2423703.1 DUF2788 domain-containing protein [Thalassolituus alkanivorans]|tara:strand:+ start:149 stop:349 length:201 start_codon:yes stop_codon:yes gene_type:complete